MLIQFLFVYLSALVFFLLTICNILPAVKSRVFENRRTLISLDNNAASYENNNINVNIKTETCILNEIYRRRRYRGNESVT